MSDHNGHTDGSSPFPMSPEQFAQYLERRLVLNDDEVEIQGRTGTQLRLRVNGQDVVADAMHFYQAYASDPTQLDVVARHFVQALLSGLPDRTVREFNVLADRIFPMLKPIAMLATVRERNLPMIVYREFLADL